MDLAETTSPFWAQSSFLPFPSQCTYQNLPLSLFQLCVFFPQWHFLFLHTAFFFTLKQYLLSLPSHFHSETFHEARLCLPLVLIHAHSIDSWYMTLISSLYLLMGMDVFVLIFFFDFLLFKNYQNHEKLSALDILIARYGSIFPIFVLLISPWPCGPGYSPSPPGSPLFSWLLRQSHANSLSTIATLSWDSPGSSLLQIFPSVFFPSAVS